jgi:hypothetical protein
MDRLCLLRGDPCGGYEETQPLRRPASLSRQRRFCSRASVTPSSTESAHGRRPDLLNRENIPQVVTTVKMNDSALLSKKT